MKRFADLDTFLAGDEPGLELTIGGTIYTVPPPDAETGLWCERIAAAAGNVHMAKTDAEIDAASQEIEKLPTLPGDLTFAQRVLTVDTYAAMVAGGVDHVRIRIAASTALAWIVSGEQAAEAVWIAGGRPESPGPNRATRRASNSMDVERTMKPPVSMSGTNSQSTSRRARKARRSHGQRSSRTGGS
jgi:hypothetical protein